MATIIDGTLPHDGEVGLIPFGAPSIADTWNPGRGQANDIFARLRGVLTVVVATVGDLADHAPPEAAAQLAIVTQDMTAWGNWGADPAGDGTAPGADGTRWARLSPTPPRTIYHDQLTTAVAPGPDEDVEIARVQARTGAHGLLSVRLVVEAGWTLEQTSPGVSARLRLNMNGTVEDERVVEIAAVDGERLEIEHVVTDYAGQSVTVTAYARGFSAPAGHHRLLTALAD